MSSRDTASSKNPLEMRRQLLHLGSGLVIVILLNLGILDLMMLGIIFGVGLALSLMSTITDVPLVSWFLKTFDRKPKLPGKGALTFLLGMIASLYLFDNVMGRKDIALAAIMVLVVGDSISHLVGRYFGRIAHPLNNMKLIEGTAAGIIGAFLGAVLFVPPLEAGLGAFFAMVLESVEFKIGEHIVDDNISVPLVAGLVFYLVGIVF